MASAARYKGYRYPIEVIGHAVWLYHRFALSLRDVEELLIARGVLVSYGTIGKRAGDSRRRASYSTRMSLLDTRYRTRPRGPTFGRNLNVVPSPGIFAKICCGPRTICPLSTS